MIRKGALDDRMFVVTHGDRERVWSRYVGLKASGLIVTSTSTWTLTLIWTENDEVG